MMRAAGIGTCVAVVVGVLTNNIVLALGFGLIITGALTNFEATR